MSKNKKGGSSSSSRGKKGTVEIDPSVVRFTHARIRPFFTGCGKKIEDTIKEIIDGVTSISDLPLITVIENGGELFSLNNRRLYTIKYIQSLGLLPNDKVTVFMKPALEREKKRYTPERCSLQARIMLEQEHSGNGEDDQDASASEDEKQTNFGEPRIDAYQHELSETDNLDNCLSALDICGISSRKGKNNFKPPNPNPQNNSPCQHELSNASTLGDSVGKTETISKTSKSGGNVSLPAEVSKNLKELNKLVSKGKKKVVMSTIDEWEMAGLITDAQREYILHTIGM